MEQFILGIDISKTTFHAVLLHQGREHPHSFSNNVKGFVQLGRWLKHRGADHVHACMEATGGYGEALAYHLAEAGHIVSVVNPARIKGFAQSELVRNKTDASDAAIIARFSRAMQPAPWQPPPPEVRELQGLVRRLGNLQRAAQQEANRVAMPGLSAPVQRSIEEHLCYLSAEIARLEKLIREHIKQHPQLRSQRDLLTSIPGIGDTTAAAVLSEIPDIAHFRSAKQLAAFAGVSPRQWQSGSSIKGRTRLAKMGNPQLRKALFYPAMVAIRFNPIVRTFALRLRATGKSKLVVLGAAMRKLIHLIYGILKSGTPFNPQHSAFA